MTEPRLTARSMTTADIAFGMHLVAVAGWNQTERDWHTFLELRPHGCFVARLDGIDAGTVTTVEHGNENGWIGMVLVDPPRRRQGVGRLLVETAVDSLGECAAIWLDATPAGRKVYEPMGFVAVCELARYARDTVPTGSTSTTAGDDLRAMREDDLDAVCALDRCAFDADRSAVLRTRLDRAPRFARVVETRDGIVGYSLGRDGRRGEHVGPIVAPDATSALQLLDAALEAARPRPIIVDAFADDAWNAALRVRGFRVERPFIRMVRGARTTDSSRHTSAQWASGGPEMG